jgi:ABC-2 type transport system permease protein
MNTMKWLVKREYWENKGGIFWAPTIVAAAFTVLMSIAILLSAAGVTKGGGMHINGVNVHQLSGVMTEQHKIDAANGIAMSYLPITGLLLAVMAFVVFFYSLSSLYDDRRDKSVLFWKSMPISDSQTVFSKLFTILVVTPLVPLALGVVVTLVFSLVAAAAMLILGVNLFGYILSSSDLYLLPIQLLACLPIFIIWAFPSVAWFMMVSAWARRFPILWAVGIPVILGVLLSISEGMTGVGIPHEWYWENIVGRLFGGFIPGTWLAFFDSNSNVDIEPGKHSGLEILKASWAILGYAKVWIAVGIGAAMTYAAIRLRRYRDEG